MISLVVGQLPPQPDPRQFNYPTAGIGMVVANPCESIDAQYPERPCSPPKDQPTPPSYLPSYQPPAAMRPPYMDYNRYPYASEKQIDGIFI